MRELSGAEMRREYNLMMEALKGLKEKFLKDGDPTIVVGDFLEKSALLLSNIREVYNRNAKYRENIIDSVLEHLGNLEELVAETKQSLHAHVQAGEPEDSNRSIE